MNIMSDEKKQQVLEAIEKFPKNMKRASEYANLPFNTFVYRAKRLGVYAPNPNQWEERRKRTEELSWEECSPSEKRRRVLTEQNHKCISCGIEDWMGQKITLELDHIDGNRSNNHRDNLRVMCPNCHSLTPTFRRSSKHNRHNTISDEDFTQALKEHTSIRQALLHLDLSLNDGNYRRAHKLLKAI